MAKYLILIYGDEQQWNGMTPQEWQRYDEGHEAFHAAAGSGVLGGGELAESSMATTLRGGLDGKITTTDGPFLETKEALGGYYLIEAADLDQAISFASRLPELSDSHCGIEIRPAGSHK
jgi:hypothetical protein